MVVLVVGWRPDVAALSGWREGGRQTFLFHPSSFLLHQPLDLPLVGGLSSLERGFEGHFRQRRADFVFLDAPLMATFLTLT